MNSIIIFLLYSISADFLAKERLNIALEYDTNIYKSASSELEPITSDFDLRLQSDLNLRYRHNKNILRVNLINAGKLFFSEHNANTLANQIEFSYLYRNENIQPEVGIELKDITTLKTIQDYTIIRPYTALNYDSKSAFIKLLSGYEKFIFDFNNNYSYEGFISGIMTALKIGENLNINLNYSLKYVLFDSLAYKKLGNLERDTLLVQKTDNERRDFNHNFILRLNYESDIILSITYNPEVNSSNSAGESVFRQRFQLSMTTILFYKIYLNMLLSIMISSFKDGILISDELLLLNDNENRNYIILKLAREIYKNTLFELKYSYYHSEFSNYTTQFSRNVLSTGFCLKF